MREVNGGWLGLAFDWLSGRFLHGRFFSNYGCCGLLESSLSSGSGWHYFAENDLVLLAAATSVWLVQMVWTLVMLVPILALLVMLELLICALRNI